MSLKHRIMPLLSQAVTHTGLLETQRKWLELKRRAAGKPHTVTFYYRVDDPYSHLLAQILPAFLRHYPVKLEIKVVPHPDEGAIRHPELWINYALRDCRELAGYYPVEIPKEARPPVAASVKLANAILLHCETPEKFLETAVPVGNALWSGNRSALIELKERQGAASDEAVAGQLTRNRNQLARRGHYLSGMLYYEREWYWGLDRIRWLEERLQALGVPSSGTGGSFLQKRPENEFPAFRWSTQPAPRPIPVDFYFSFRSPYSYVALARVRELTQKYPVSLRIKPLMPMVMRGVPLPQQKKIYILLDAKREAVRFNVPYGKICDPLDGGIPGCLALFPFAEAEGKAFDYIFSLATGIWAEGVDVSSETGLRSLVERAGLSWAKAQPWLHDPRGMENAEDNRNELFKLGLWGVPSFRLDTFSTWGQDRIWLLEEKLKRLTPGR